MLRQVSDSNGLETWRQLRNLYTPKTKVRSMAILSALMSYPNFVKDKALLEQIQNLERIGDEYRKASGHDVSDDILLATLVRVLPRHVQQHVQLGMDDNSAFQQIKDRVVAYERVSSSWNRDKVLIECGATTLGSVTSYGAGDQDAAPMDINQLQQQINLLQSQKGKGKGKGKDKGKGKGKSPFKGKGKGKGYGGSPDKGKGKQQQKGSDSKGKGKSKNDPNVCNYCHKSGHWERDCYKKQKDQQQVRVLPVEAPTLALVHKAPILRQFDC